MFRNCVCLFAEGLEDFHFAVEFQKVSVFLFVVEGNFAFSVIFGYLNRESCCRFYVERMAGTCCTAGYRLLCGDGYTYYRGICSGCGLQDAV